LMGENRTAMENSGGTEIIREMIQKEIQSIGCLEERVAFKGLMEGVFLSLYETNCRMYEGLEKRIEEELAYDQERYRIQTGIIEKKYLDVSHHLFCPMDEEDLKERRYGVPDIRKALEETGIFSLMKVMLCCDFLEIKKLWEIQPVFEGRISTQQGSEWKIEVRLQENRHYLDRIEGLYELFVKNGIPWKTVNAPYLYKMADMVLTGLPEGISENERIEQVSIRFGEYSSIIREHLVPVWNIRKLELESTGFPVPCGDHKSYEHTVSLRSFGGENAYLAGGDRMIRSVSQSGERLRIVSETGEARKWDVFMLRSSREHKIDRYTYPLMQNGRAESFAERYQGRWAPNIRTKTELSHFLKGFGMEGYVRYQGCSVEEAFPDGKETYPLNSFIEDEIRNPEAQKKLVLFFRKGEKEGWLQRDVMSFLTAEVQRVYPEYDCGGVLL
jgi:hypothetical protein